MLYFLKLIQIGFLFFFIKIYFEYGGTGSQILSVVTISVFFGGLLGISDTLIQSIFNVRLFSSIIPDRVQYYGIILLMLAYISIQLTNISPENFSKKRKIQLVISFIIGVISVFMCGKRTMLLALIFLMLYAVSKFKMTIASKFLILTIFFAGALTLPLVVNFETTFQRDSTSLSAGLSEDYAYDLDNSALGNVEVSGLDYSLTERLAKWVKSAALIKQSPIIGTGYWGSPYAHNFLPDNGIFQVAVEMGLLGLFSLLFFLYVSSKTPLKKSKRDIYNSRRIILPNILIVISLTANPFYIFNLMAIYLILILGWIERFNNKIRL